MKSFISTIFLTLANGEKFGSSEVSKDLKFGWDLQNVRIESHFSLKDSFRTAARDLKDHATRSRQQHRQATQQKTLLATSCEMLSTFPATSAKRRARLTWNKRSR